MPGAAGVASECVFSDNGPVTFSIASIVMDPSRYKTGEPSSNPMMVDSIPLLHSPPSKIVKGEASK